MRLRRPMAVTTIICLTLVVSLTAYVGWRQWIGNFATVVVNEAYRSNQPTPERLADYVKEYQIRTVINLRGASPGADWYEAERKAAADLGIRLVDFQLSASKELTHEQADALLAVLRDAERPLLIHCRSGSDRTGLASAVYQAMVAGIDEHLAEDQLSIRYGHFSVPFLSEAWPMDVSWQRMRKWWDMPHYAQ